MRRVNTALLVLVIIAATILSAGWLSSARLAYAFHFPWDQGHDTFKPTQPPDAGPCQGSNCNPCNSSRSPVYVPTGHFVWGDTDIVLRGRPYIGMTRTYNSNDPRAGLFGNGWSVGCDVGLYVTTSGSALHFIYRAPDGKRYEYVVQADGTVTSPPGRFEQVLPQSDGTVQILYLDNTRQVFRADGRLAASLDANGNRVNYSYDTSDRLVGISDSNGRALTLAYNASGRVARVTDHGGRVWQYAYDADANLIAVTDPLGGVRRYEYGVFTPQGGDVTYHQLTKITDASGVVVTQVTYSGERVASYTKGANRFAYAYNTATKTVTKTDSLASRWTFTYNAEGLIVQETDPLGNGIARLFDGNGREISRTDQIGAVWTSTYDSLGRQLSHRNPLGDMTTFAYEGSNPTPVRVTSPSGRVTAIAYDSRLNPLSTTDPAGGISVQRWSLAGDLVGITDASGNQRSFSYTSTGLQDSFMDPLARSTTWTFDVLGRPLTVQNPAGATTQTSYDAFDRLIQSTDSLGQVVSFGYDPAGRLTRVIDGKGNATTFAYDSFGRLGSVTSPDARIRRTAYRADNLPGQITLADSQIITYTYDGAKRVTREKAGADVTSYSYTARNELASATGPGGGVSFRYDLAGQRIEEVSNGKTVQLVLNNEGERGSLTALGASTTYSRDIRGLVTGISTPNGSVAMMYDVLGRRTRISFANAAVTDYTYDAAGQLVSMNLTGPFSTIYGHSFDDAGRIVRRTGEGSDWHYSFDGADRLIGAVHGTDVFAYSYDVAGNLLGGGRAYDSGNRLTEDAEFVYTYDGGGNLVRKESKTSEEHTIYAWNAKGQLLRVERFPTLVSVTPTKSLLFSYDPLGRRAAKTEDGVIERYVYEGSDLIAVLDDAGSTLEVFTFGPWLDEPLMKEDSGVIQFLQANYLGSVVAVTSLGGVAAEYHYDPWGKTVVDGEQSNRFRYTGREQDAPDLYYYRARYYDPSLGRFLSEDPVGIAGGDINLYRYVLNNPVGLKDPGGEDWLSATGNFFGGLVIGAGVTVAVSAGIASGTVIGAGVAVVLVGVGAYQGTIALQELILGRDPYTGAPLTTEERIDIGAGLAGAVVGGGLAGRGFEIEIGRHCRIAPVGNRTGNPTGELPHYHRAVPDPSRPGNSVPGQGIGRHRPWDTRSGDTSFWDRF